ncbi:hypothetical protein O6H91_22G029000 [Diphasiastrum complanatum]|uniref:Uncharacterized protein n=1 Tax=Diphasiastrum complanatum TaxID=34168 RepID=A0ACC2AE14_DIPCM|nr:hypothetical protein O6H91_22G029000 [Diphasiastrum complanatum]
MKRQETSTMKRQEQQQRNVKSGANPSSARRPAPKFLTDLSSLAETPPGPSRTSRSKPSSTLQQEKGSLVSSCVQPVSKKIGRTSSLSGNATIISEATRTTRMVTSNISKMRPGIALSRKNQIQSHQAVKITVSEEEIRVAAANLPLDSLCLCFTKLESVYHIINCASVCRHWQEAVYSDAVWKYLYRTWWQPDHSKDSRLQSLCVSLPLGVNTWKQAFIAKYSDGKILSEEINLAIKKGWLHNRRMRDKHGKLAIDCIPGDTMKKLVDRLSLTFQICVNHNKPIGLKGKADVVYFPASCLLRYPTKFTNSGFSLAMLNSVKILATSDKLLRTITVATFSGKDWEMVSRAGANSGLLHLIQQCNTNSASLIAGTLCECLDGSEPISTSGYEQEPLLLLIASIHLSDFLWKLLELGWGFTPQMDRRIVRDNADPTYGLHGWHVSIQLHTFRKLFWSKDFHQVVWNLQESVSGEQAVFPLISTHEIIPGVLSSSWRTEAFSGELRGIFMIDFTLWDENSEIAWQCTRAICSERATMATIEYGPPGIDGERIHAAIYNEKQGISVSLKLCIPFMDLYSRSSDEKPVFAVTDLRFALSSKFLTSWFGRSTI